VVYPAFQALDVFGPLDALNLLSIQTPINLSIIASTLDPVPTQQDDPMGSYFSQSIVPTHTFADPPKDIDVLMIPGGLGNRNTTRMTEVANFVAAFRPEVKYLFTVCTGAAIAAKAGVLDGKKATSNKNAWEWVKSLGPNVDWIAHARWVEDGDTWTTSGVTAGIDGMFAFMSEKYGEDMAANIAMQMEYTRELNSTNDPWADYHNL